MEELTEKALKKLELDPTQISDSPTEPLSEINTTAYF